MRYGRKGTGRNQGQTELKVESAAHGTLSFRALGQRGGCAGDLVLLWESGETGKDVVMVKEMVG